MSDYTRSERLELCDLLDSVGPDHPTLCEGWTTHDLAAHLVVREANMIAGPLAVVAKTGDRMAAAKRRPYADLVAAIRTGPPRGSVFSIPKLGSAANLAEYFVHQEDVRRAGPGAQSQPRPLPRAEEDALWRRVTGIGKLLGRSSPVPLALRSDERTTVVKRRGSGERVVVTGRPGELLLVLFGRGAVADVTYDGPPESVAAVKQAEFGI